MNEQEKETVRKELWFWYFTQILYNDGVISNERMIELEKRIARLGFGAAK